MKRLLSIGVLFCVLAVLVGCGGGGGGTTPPPPPATPTPTPPHPPAGASSFGLIKAALAAGTIDAETALTYRVFATFGDPRLPAQYAGDNSGVEHDDALMDAQAAWSSLSPAAQDVIGPFLAPPAYIGSRVVNAVSRAQSAHRFAALDLATYMCQRPEFDPNWKSTPISGGNVRVWYDTTLNDGAYAVKVADIVNNEVWPKLFGTLGMKAPLKDKTSTDAYEGCNGSDDRLDIYLATLNTRAELGHALPIVPGRRAMPVFLVVDRTLSDPDLRFTLTHELMHASQWAYNVQSATFSTSHKWMREATATWAGDYVYPRQNYEQTKADDYFLTPHLSIEQEAGVPEDRMYGAYLFFQFVANKAGGPSRIPLMWAQTELVEDQLDAIDAALLAGFNGTWHLFAKHHWNQDPVQLDSYDAWDPPTSGSTVGKPTVFGGAPIQVDLGGRDSKEYEMDTNVPHLATHYHHFRFVDGTGAIPNDLRSVTLEHVVPLQVQAIFRKIGGTWQVEDWSPVSGSWVAIRRSCFDVRAERYAELVIVVSNGNPHVDAVSIPDQRLRLGVNNIGCWRWQGRASTSFSWSGEGGSGNLDADATDVIWERVPPFELGSSTQSYKVISGKFAASSQAEAAGCRQRAQITNVSVLENGGSDLRIQNYGLTGWDPQRTAGLALGGYEGRAFSGANAPGVAECKDRSIPITVFLGDEWFKAGKEIGRLMTIHNGTMTETFVTEDGPQGQINRTWTFTPLREP